MTELHVWTQEGDFLGGISIQNQVAELWDMDGAVDTRIIVGDESGERLWDIVLNTYADELGVDDSELYLADANDSEILWAP